MLSNKAPEIVSPGWKTCLFSARTIANRGGMVYRCFSNYPCTQSWGKVILWRKKSLVFKIFLHNMAATRKNNCCVTLWNCPFMNFLANNGNEIVLRVSGIRWVWEFNKTNCTLRSIYFGSVVFLTTYQIKSAKNRKKIVTVQTHLSTQSSLGNCHRNARLSLSRNAICSDRAALAPKCGSVFRISCISKPVCYH